jgi:uncharacterized membrane protein
VTLAHRHGPGKAAIPCYAMTASQRVLAAFFTFTGVMHFVIPKQYEATVPGYIPISAHDAVVYSGYAEIAGALAVIPPATRGLARWWLIALLVAVFPANVHMAVNPEQIRGLDLERVPRWALWARLPFQPLMIWWVWKAAR